MTKIESILANCYDADIISFEDIHAIKTAILTLMNTDEGVKTEYKVNYGKQSWEILTHYCDPC